MLQSNHQNETQISDTLILSPVCILIQLKMVTITNDEMNVYISIDFPLQNSSIFVGSIYGDLKLVTFNSTIPYIS